MMHAGQTLDDLAGTAALLPGASLATVRRELARALRWLASSHAMVISSRLEGGANVVCEALRIGVPVLASRIPGNLGLLGTGYAGYFEVGDERSLARLMQRAASEPQYYRTLKRQIRPLRGLVSPRSEARALLAALSAAVR